MGIYIVLGSQGSGKTLFLTRQAFGEYKRGRTVYTNYDVGFPHRKLLFKDMINTKLENACVIIDEAALFGFNSRDSLSRENKELSARFTIQVRKKGVDLFCSAVDSPLTYVWVESSSLNLSSTDKDIGY